MKSIGIAVWAELLKARKSKMFIGTLIFFAFIGIMMGILMYLARHPEIANRSEVISAKVSFLGNGDWESFINILIQMILTVGTIGFGLVTAWTFGREYSERVLKDILALPVSRITIVFSKFIAVFLWCFLLSIVIFAAGSITGFVSGMSGWSAEIILHRTGTFIECALLNILLSSLVGFIASLGRGYLLSIAYVILTLIITQLIFVGMPAFATYLPWAFPALYSKIAGPVAPEPSVLSLLIYIFSIIGGFFATAFWWRYADLKQ